MSKMHTYRLILAGLLIHILAANTAAQWVDHEYLVTVNPATGAINRIDSIPGIMYKDLFAYTTLDDKNHRFIFIGRPPDKTTRYFLSLDAVSGAVLSKSPVPNSPSILLLKYAAFSNLLYGVTVSSNNSYALVSVNLNTGAYTSLAALPGISSVNEIILDNTNHRLFLKGIDHSGRFTLFTVALSNGYSVSQVTVPNITGIQYDNTTGRLYALSWGTGPWKLVNLDIFTGSISVIASLPAHLVGILQGNETFNEVSHHFIFAGTNQESKPHLYSVNAFNGTVVYQPFVPASSTSIDKDNVMQFRYSNSLNKLYALHWKAQNDTVVPAIPAIPPASGCALDDNTQIYQAQPANTLVVKKMPTKCPVRVTLYSVLGQAIIENRLLSDGQNNILLPFLVSGVYLYKLFSGNSILKTGRILLKRS